MAVDALAAPSGWTQQRLQLRMPAGALASLSIPEETTVVTVALGSLAARPTRQLQFCGSGMFIPDLKFYPFLIQIPDPKSNNSNKRRVGEKLSNFVETTNITKF